jgi:hypothetical protein
MAHVKLRLTGCERFNFKGELYEKGKTYLVGGVKAKLLLRKQDEYGRDYFSSYVKPEKSMHERAAEAAAKAAAAAMEAVEREEDEVIVREDGSEPVDDRASEEVQESPEVVDTDDDDSLDEENEPNPEEYDEDRDDGSAIQV